MSGRLKMRLMGWITFINVTIGIALGGLLYTIWPEHYFKWYPSIPIFYWIMAMAMTYVLDLVKRKNGDVTITTFMVVRKFTLAIVFLWLYAQLINERLKAFGFTLMLFYFIYLGLETYTIYLFEKKRIKREKKENDEQCQK